MRRSRIAGPSRAARDEHRLLADAPAADPGGLAGALKPGSPPVGDYLGRPGDDPADRAYLIAGTLQTASYSPVRMTISVMAGQAGTDRWVMTGGIFLVGGCYLVTAAGLTGVRASARALLAVAGMAGIGIAASPEPARGPTPRHLAWTVLGAVTIAVWPAFAARRAAPRPPILSVYGSAAVTAISVALLGWLLAETRDGSVQGLAERLPGIPQARSTT
jgi:hypothetical protein